MAEPSVVDVDAAADEAGDAAAALSDPLDEELDEELEELAGVKGRLSRFAVNFAAD